MITHKNMQKAALLGPQDMSFDRSQCLGNNSAGGQEYMNGEQKKGGRIDNSARKTILVCDDETDLLLMFRIHLESRYNVLTVDSGKACIDKLIDRKNKNEKIDLLLLDYKLGDISGDVVARKVKDIANTKIVLITAFELDDKVIQDLVQNKYVVDVIKKPILLEQLSQKIEENMK
jgi:CheY-like chemotaxis protein